MMAHIRIVAVELVSRYSYLKPIFNLEVYFKFGDSRFSRDLDAIYVTVQ